MAVLEFIVSGTPVSVQASRDTRRFWQQRVATAASQAAGEWVPSGVDKVVLSVAYFYVDEPAADLDNIVKPLQDALKRIAYEDDVQVADLIASMRPNTEGRRLKLLTEMLTAALSGESDFVYVRVGHASRIEVFR
jgi:Holliday junction resolvase RusA-like endonuclease